MAAVPDPAAGGDSGGPGPVPPGGPDVEHYLEEAVLEELERVSRDPGSAQRQALRGILEKHGRCEYLERLGGLEGRTDAGSFRAAVPLSSHADYADYIERIKEGAPRQGQAAGERHLLCCSPLVALSKSSGTTGGASKYFLVSQDLLHHTVRTQYIQQALMRRSFPSKLPAGVGKAWYTYQSGARADTPGGLKASTVTTVTIHSPEYARFYAAAGAVSPLPVVRCAHMHQGMYAHLLCALSAADAVEGMYGSFAFSLVELFRTLRRVWPSLCRDVREGRVCADAVTDEELRRVLMTEVVVAPNPAAADRIQTHCSSADWDGILLRLFPNLQFIVAACSGSMAPYAAALDALTRPGFPRLGFGYGSSEAGHCAFHLPPDDLEAGTPAAAGPDTFVLWPRSLYYEFIPVDPTADGSLDAADAADAATGTTTTTTTVELAELQLGRDYELVVTTPAGLYRYQQTDVVRVAAFHRAMPVLEFVARKGVLLSINTDKTDEAELQAVVARAAAGAAPAPVAVANFSSHADHSSAPGHYVIYWELEEQQREKDSEAQQPHQQQQEQQQQQQLQGCCDAMDAALNEPYRRGRRHGFIGPLELRVLAPGTFNRVRDVAAGLGGSLTQFKVPRCVVNPAFLAVLDAGTLRAFHSTHLHV